MSSPSKGGGSAGTCPPPLIFRFLRSNVGNKSKRGRKSRSSPIFIAQKKNVAATIEAQEPSSPKVSCVGQVRVSHSMIITPTKSDQLKESKGTRTCFSFMKCSACTPGKLSLRRWASFLWFGCCKKVDVEENASLELDKRDHCNDGETEVTGNEGGEAQIEEREDSEEVIRGTPTPPKNALFLTRCRSAPFRSSSFAARFRGDIDNGREAEMKMTSHCCDFNQPERESENQMSIKLPIDGGEREQICAIGKQEEGDSSIRKSMEQVGMPHPLLLMRCKSASASKTGKEQA